MATLSPSAKQQFLDDAGNPAAGFKLYTYASGTTTPLATYSDAAASVPNTNPITLDARGEAVIYLEDQEYTFVLKDADGLTTIWTRDNVSHANYQIRAALSDSVTAGNGADMIEWKRASAATVAHKLSTLLQATRRNVSEYLTNAGDPITASVMNAALADMTAGGILLVPPGTHQIEDTVWCPYPVIIECDSATDKNTNTNGDDADTCTFWWKGADNGVMFLFSTQSLANINAGTTTTDTLFGCGIRGCKLLGRSGPTGGAATGVWMASTQYGVVEIDAYALKAEAVLLDGGNGALSYGNSVQLKAVWGVDSAQAPMHGIRTRSKNGFTSTQNDFWVTGLLKDGDFLHLEDTDNNRIHTMHGTIQGTGYVCRFLNGSNAFPAQNNVIFYASGNIKCESQTFNRVIHHISESGTIVCDSGAVLHYSAMDYVTGALYQTPAYTMYDSRWVPAKDWASVAGGADGVTALLYPSKDMADAATSTLAYLAAPPFNWNDGNLTAVVVYLCCDSAAAGNVRVNIKLSTIGLGTESLATPEYTEAFTVTPSTSAYVPTNHVCVLTTPKGFTKGQALAVVVERLGADAADTKTATAKFLGANLIYVSTGPHSPGSGPYNLPAMGA